MTEIKKLLELSCWTLHNRQNLRAIEKTGATFGDSENDTEIKADRVLGKLLRDHLVGEASVGRISVEGLEDVRTGQGSDWWCIDPLDGSLNYLRSGATRGLPHSTCITVLNQIDDATFSDVRTAGVIDLRNADTWMVEGGDMFGLPAVTLVNCRLARTCLETKLDLGSQVVIGEMYYPENRELLARAFAGKKGWLRNPGSAAYEMALVASGEAIAYVCDRQKQHELGAAYALVKGAGGVAVDFEGKDLGSRVYDFKTQTPVVLAANQAIAEQILTLLRKA